LTELITAARHVNDRQPGFVVNLVKRAVGNKLNGIRIAALGLAFKPDVDDLRESPAIETARLLAEAGATVRSYEPYKPNHVVPGVSAALTIEDTIRNAQVLLLLVGHRELKELDPMKVKKITSAQWAIDTVGGWDRQLWTEAGFKFTRLGDGKNVL
jgi:UDP-N-acetyl-D-mannosaminuronic acid dehydrogenase